MRAFIFLAALTVLLQPLTARAFEGEVHEAITRAVARSMDYDDAAIDAIVAGNLATDKDEFNDPAAHFDSETFEGGSKRLREKMELAVQSLLACDRAKALENIGRAIHAVQDFFAHSNFVEIGGVDGFDILHLKNPDKGVVCNRKTFQGPLTTGYWPDDKRPSEIKCIHAELNKDAPLNDERHLKARAYAAQETGQIMALIEKQLSDHFKDPLHAEAAVAYLKLGPEALESSGLSCPFTLVIDQEQAVCRTPGTQVLPNDRFDVLRQAVKRLAPLTGLLF